MKIEIDLDDIWPAASTLMGLQFATDSDFARCRDLLRADEDIDRWNLLNPRARYAVVRRSDLHLFSAAGLEYEEIELIDLDDLPAEERYERQRAMIESEAVQKKLAEMVGRSVREPS